MAFFLNDLDDFFDGTLFSVFGRSRNNRYISQPNFNVHKFSLDRTEQWVSINEAEKEIYNTTPEIKLVIDRLSRMYANGIWKHLDANGDEIEDSEVIDLLDNPNVFQSSKEYLKQWFIQRCVYANVFNFQLLGSQFDEIPSALWNLAPSRMVVNRTGKIYKQMDIEGIIKDYTFRLDQMGSEEKFSTKEIIQFSIPDVDDPIIGVSPFVALRMPISNIRAAYGFRNVILTKKGAMGVWSSDSKDAHGSIELTDPEVERMENQLIESYGIGDNQRSIVISNKAMKFTPAVFPTKQLMLFEEIDADMRRIVDMYGANDNMFSREKGGTFTNKDAGEMEAYQDTLQPVAEDHANGYAKRWGLLEKGERLTLTFDHLPIFKENEGERSEIDKRKAETVEILVMSGMKFEDAAEIVEWDVTGKTISTPVPRPAPTTAQ